MTPDDPAPDCSHPWLRVTCGVCGQAVDALGSQEPAGPGEEQPDDPAPGGSQGLFIVARGHPELVEQLRAVLGHRSDIEVIEDRRRRSRELVTPEQAQKLRKRLRDDA